MKRWEHALYWLLLVLAVVVFLVAVWLAFHAEGLLTDMP